MYGDIIVLDAKNKFRHVFTLEDHCAEVVDFPRHNPKLIFSCNMVIEYFGVAGSPSVSLNLQYDSGMPIPVPVKNNTTFELDYYRKMKQMLIGDEAAKIVLYHLFADLTTRGDILYSRKYALELGYSVAEFKIHFHNFIEILKDWKYFSVLCDFNKFHVRST